MELAEIILQVKQADEVKDRLLSRRKGEFNFVNWLVICFDDSSSRVHALNKLTANVLFAVA